MGAQAALTPDNDQTPQALEPTPETGTNLGAGANLNHLGDTQPIPVLRYQYVCPDCGFENSYQTPLSHANGKRAHERQCKVRRAVVSSVPILNGHSADVSAEP